MYLLELMETLVWISVSHPVAFASNGSFDQGLEMVSPHLASLQALQLLSQALEGRNSRKQCG